MSRLFLPIILLVLVISLAACDDNGDTSPTATFPSGGEPPSPTDAADDTPTEAAEPTAPSSFEGSLDPIDVDSDGGGSGTLTDVRAAAQVGFDRIVFEFDGARPGYTVQFVDTAIACGSGETVNVDGAVLLEIHMTPAAAHDDAGEPTFDSQEIAPGLDTITEAVQTCDFEANVTWVLGLTHEAEFSATHLADPFRVVIDVAHP